MKTKAPDIATDDILYSPIYLYALCRKKWPPNLKLFDTTWREWHFNILTDDYISPTLKIVAVPFVAREAGAGVGRLGYNC